MMSEPEAPLFNPDSEPEEEALGLKEPLGIIQRFIVPLGARSLTVLDPSIFLRGEIQEDSFQSSVQDSPRFQESAPAMQGEIQLGQGQTVDLPNAENALSETIQRQEFEVETPSLSLHSPPIAKGEATPTTSLGQRPSSPILGGSDPQNPLRLGRPELQSPPELGDLDFDVSAQPNVGECNVFATFQTASEMAQSASDSLESSYQSVSLPENPSTEPQSVEKSLTNSASTTVQTQETEASEMGRPSEVVQVRSFNSEQNDTPRSGENSSNTNVNLQRSSIPSNEVGTIQSPPILRDLGGERKVLDTSQKSSNKDVDQEYEGFVSQASDTTASFNIEQTIQQNVLQSFSEVEAIDTDPSLQDRISEAKIIDSRIDPLVDVSASLPDLIETPSSSLHSPRLTPLAVSPKSPILGDFEIEAADSRESIADSTIRQLCSDSVEQGEVSTSESTEATRKEPFDPSGLSNSQQNIEVGELISDATVMRSLQPPETSDAIAPQVTPRTETHLEAKILQPRLDDSASVDAESFILPESPNITSLEIEPSPPLTTNLQADAKGISSQKSAETKTSSKVNPKSLLSKTIQFLSKAAASIVTTQKQQPSSEASTQIESSSVQTDSIRQFEERPSQSLQTQEEPTLSRSPMIAKSPLIQPEMRLPEMPIQHSVPDEVRSPETESLIEESAQTETGSSEPPIQRSIQAEGKSPEAETLNRQTLQAEIQSLETEAPTQQSVQSEGLLLGVEPFTEPSVQIEAQLPETLIQPSVQIEGRSPEVAPSIEQSVQADTGSSETPVQSSAQAEGQVPEEEPLIEPFVQAEPSLQRSVQPETQSSETLTEKSVQPESRSSKTPIQTEGRSPEVETPNRQTSQAEIRAPEAEAPTQQSFQSENPSPEQLFEQFVQPETRSPEADLSIQRSIQVEGRSTELFIERSIQAEVQLPEAETPTQASVQTKEQTPVTETPIQRSIQLEEQLSEAETPVQSFVQAEGGSLDISIETSFQADAESSESDPVIQRSVQAEGRSPDTETPIQTPIQSTETPIQHLVEIDARSLEIDSPIQRPIQAEGQTQEVERLNEQSIQAEARSNETSIQRSVKTDALFSEEAILTQQSVQAKTLSSETPIEQSIQPEEVRSPKVESSIEQAIQIEADSPEVETLIPQPVQVEARSLEVDSEIQRFVQPETRFSETPIQASVQAEVQASETLIESSAQSEIQSLETPIQASAQVEEQTPETPIQQFVQPETQLPEAEFSIQETVQMEGRSPSTDSPIQRVVQPPTHETIQPPQYPSSSSQPEKEVASELITSDTEKVQPIFLSELAIARETTSEPLSETAIAPYWKFSQLPTILQNLSILKPLVQNTVQRIPEQSHASSYPPIGEGQQILKPPELGSHFRGRVPRLEESGADLGGQRRGLATPPISLQESIAADSIITVQKSPTQYAKIDIPPRKTKMAEVRSPSTPSVAIAPKTTLQTKRQNPSGVIQMARNQTVIPEGKEEIPLETDTSASDISQDLETLAQTIYAQLQQRLRIDRERHGHGAGRFPW
jgi:hypothetical protein